MIIKEKAVAAPADKFARAGYEAEKQMAFYLRRAFGDALDVRVFNDLRFVRNDEVGQIDHLVLHRFGLALIESKSVTGTLEVNPQLEFVRVYGRQRTAIKSPIAQVELQKQLLKSLLNDHKEALLRKVLLGMVQWSFSNQRFKTFVAISDQGEIRRCNCDPPELVKADRASFEIQQIIDRHTKASGLGGMMRQLLADKETAKRLEEDDLFPFTNEEVDAICEFLLREHREVGIAVEPPPITSGPPLPSTTTTAVRERTAVPPPPPLTTPLPTPSPASQACRHCRSHDIEITYGQYGYYFKCRCCSKNTPIDFKCEGCDKKFRISKKGQTFTRVCSACGSESHFFTNSN